MLHQPIAGAKAQSVSLAELVGAFSYALDITEGQPPGHSVRACWIGSHIGAALGLGENERHDLHYTLLLKDLGCSSNAARICQLYLTDDLAFKHDFKQIDGSLPQALRFVLSHTGLKAGLAERFRAIINIFQNGGDIARELIETRCHRGADIARKMRFPEAVALAWLGDHDAAMSVIRREIGRGWMFERYLTETLSGKPDPLVEPLRGRADFQQLMREVREQNATAFAELKASGRPLVPDLKPDNPELASR